MSGFEGETVDQALALYSVMSRGLMAGIAEQPVGEAVLTDLRACAAADAAALGIVRSLVAELPQAEKGDDGTSFSLANVDDVPRLRGTVIWGPESHGNLAVYLTDNTPYYLVGSQTPGGHDSSTAELLLAPATKPVTQEDGQRPPFGGLLVVTSWAGELREADTIMARMSHAKVTAEEVEGLFNPVTQDLRLDNHAGVTLTGAKAGRSDRKVHKGAEQMREQYEKGDGTALPVIEDLKSRRVDYVHGLSRQARTNFNVFPRLVHLATLFGKTELLRELVRTLHDEDQVGAVDALIAEA